MVNGDRFGDEPPEWFQLIEAARYLKVSPWDLERQPVKYYDWAIMAMNAKADADEEKAKRRREKADLEADKDDDW